MTDLHKAAQQVLDALELAATYGSLIGPQSVIDAHEAAITALREALAKPDVPEGWKLVPVEPTPGMLNAFWQGTGAERPRSLDAQLSAVQGAWNYMLAAAPQPKDTP